MEDPSKIVREHTFGTWRKQKGWEPINIVKADGVYFYDSAGKKYLDFSSQLVNVNLGYGNNHVIKEIEHQLENLQYISPAFATETRAKAASSLLQVMPRNLTKFFFSTSGTEANEGAIKISRLVKKPSYKVVARYRAYHGSTLASMSLTGDYRRWFTEPNTMQGVVRIPEPYCYRCPLNLKYPDCGIACATYLDYVIKNEGNVASVIIEPITGTNGVVVPPKEYLPIIRKITSENNVILITDEVMTGWGRTGEWFAVNNWNVEPDILTTAKGASASYLPIGITAVNKEIAEFFEDNIFAHGHTFEAHPVTLAAIPAVIEEYKRLDLLSHVKAMGQYLGDRLKELKERHKSIGDVRGMGLFWAIELIKDSKKTPFGTYEDKYEGKSTPVDVLTKRLMNDGIYVFGGPSWLVISPPLIISKEDIDIGIEKIDETLNSLDKQFT
ncbi:aspartate aminotransferase family protein [Acidianus brierleyi]|uniref:Aspartate aminotransferase family protein n=1 Tax=Acidianus brierleyi TaxID=41673 RepID=A0A2U9IC65_9CREN|nr:aspartate aminotransferase family protein [Acidianus brierleyi]AWR93580.1 aminotransferase class III-fold pyridoxal phosphate-dependent enzyme [Acidianus brierleyi]